jgi:SAM-dependent methyltransferase
VSDPQGLSYDLLAEDYERGRAGWPSAILDGIEARQVLDLAAGTGKLTVLLVTHYDDVVAVEPLAGMRANLERKASGVRVLTGCAEQIPLDDASVDAVFVAEAFHWFDSHAAVREIERVLRPGGVVLVCFNEWGAFDPPIADSARALLEETYARLPEPGGPKIQSGDWKRGFTTPLDEVTIDHEWTTDREGVAAHYLSTSAMGALSEDERLDLREKLIARLAEVEYRLRLTARAFRTEIP